uniref:Uncharacterized protein n=1 Tax=Salix viminalis TaxID=40686 RepID=A0A6N2L865_SALVM
MATTRGRGRRQMKRIADSKSERLRKRLRSSAQPHKGRPFSLVPLPERVVERHKKVSRRRGVPLSTGYAWIFLPPKEQFTLSSIYRRNAEVSFFHFSGKATYMILSVLSSPAFGLWFDGLDFSAMIFPVVHIGAIAVSFLFVVMMFHIQIAEIHEEVLRYLPIMKAFHYYHPKKDDLSEIYGLCGKEDYNERGRRPPHDLLKGSSLIGSNPIREMAVIFSWSWP